MHIVDIHLVAAVVVETEHIYVVYGLTHNNAFRAIILNQAIALLKLLRLLESQLLRQPRHLIAEIGHKLLRFSSQNLPYAVDIAVVSLMVDVAGAATTALLDMVLQAQAPLATRYVLWRYRYAACAHRIELAYKFEHRARHRSIGIRPVVARTVAYMLPGEEHARVHLVGNHDPRIGLIVFEQHVVAGLVLLNHRIFKIKGVLLGGHHYVLHVGYVAHQYIGTQHVVGAVEVRRHPALEVLGLAYVYNPALGVEVHIHSRRIGQDSNLFFKFC